MTRVTLKMRDAVHLPSHGLEGISKADGVNLHIACLLRRMHWLFMHTCVHEEEPICSEECYEHVVDEVQKLLDDLKELAGDLGHLDCCAHIRACGANRMVHELIDRMAHELDSLHEKLRKFKLDNIDRDEDYGQHVYPGIQKLLGTSCQFLKSQYDELLKKMHDAKLIDARLMQDLRLH